MTEKFDLVVIGGGPGGYPAAIRASQLGVSVALIEYDKLGGECTNYGCVPTKTLTLLASTLRRLREIKEIKEIDVFIESFKKAAKIAKDVSSGVSTLLKGYGVEIFKEKASFNKEGNVVLDDGTEIIGKKYIIATGTDPSSLPGVGFDGELIHSNRTLLNLRKKPSNIIIVGGGYVGVEIAYIMSSLGVDVTIVEMLDRLLYSLDKDLSRYALRVLRRSGVKVKLRTPVKEIEKSNSEVVIKAGNEKLSADFVLIAIGRKPRIPEGLKYLEVSSNNKGYIIVNEHLMTSNPSVYATGDISGPPLLAHKAMIQAEIAAENALGGSEKFGNIPIPQVIFTEPEIASVGMTLNEARAKGFDSEETKFPTGGLARSRIENIIDGFIKIVYEKTSKRILGIHMAGPFATELIAEASLAVKLKIKLEELAEVIHPHPTASEELREAALYSLKKPIHYILKFKK